MNLVLDSFGSTIVIGSMATTEALFLVIFILKNKEESYFYVVYIFLLLILNNFQDFHVFTTW